MVANKIQIQSECVIQEYQIILDGSVCFKSNSDTFADFSKKAYQHFEINYPKFFKMDNLSKLAFLAADLLLKSETEQTDIALVFANKSSSLDTDVKFQSSISDSENFYPSPAVFVYTLPNICMGEICIKHQLKSENTFFIFDSFNRDFILNYAKVLIDTQKAEKVLCGWVEYFNEEYQAILYLVANENEK